MEAADINPYIACGRQPHYAPLEERIKETKASKPEASKPEASTLEASTPEASTLEASTPEASTLEASTPEASTPEASTPEASTPEASTPEASTPIKTLKIVETFPEISPDTDDPMIAMPDRMQTDEGKTFYARRKSTVEPVFGIIKNVMGFRQFMLRGLDAVSGEWNLVCIAFNLKRICALT